MKKTVLVLITFALVVAVAGCGFWLVHYFIDSKEQRDLRNPGGGICAGEPNQCSARGRFPLSFP